MRKILPFLLLGACRAAPAPAPSEPVATSGLRQVIVAVDKLE
jgi:hypothetical protein